MRYEKQGKSMRVAGDKSRKLIDKEPLGIAANPMPNLKRSRIFGWIAFGGWLSGFPLTVLVGYDIIQDFYMQLIFTVTAWGSLLVAIFFRIRHLKSKRTKTDTHKADREQKTGIEWVLQFSFWLILIIVTMVMGASIIDFLHGAT